MSTAAANCGDLRARLRAWLEGALPAGDCDRIRRHLEGCAQCQALLEEEPQTRELLRHCPPGPLPAAQARRLRERILQDWKDEVGG